MVAKKFLSLILGTVVLSTSILVGCGDSKNTADSSKNNLNIGVVQLVEHPALDSAFKGFKDGLESNGFKDGENIHLDFKNAEGDIPTAQTIANDFASSKKDLILAIATPAAQASFNATKDIPILATAVTDHAKAGLVNSMEKPETNVTGTSDMLPIDKQFDLMKKLIPNSKKVGILYNTSEANSEVQLENAKKEASKRNLEIVERGISSSNDVSQALSSIISKVDVVYTLTDNIIASSMPLISSMCLEKNIPIIGGEKAHVESGALATDGIDYYELGFQTAVMAVKIINGEKPQDMPIERLKETKLTINEDVAKKMNIQIPEDLKNKAIMVKGGVN